MPPFTRWPLWVRLPIGLALGLAVGAGMRECRSGDAAHGLPLPLPVASAPATATAASVPASAAPAPTAVAPALASAAPSDDPDPDIGPEGFGPAILRIAASGDGAEAWRALNWIRRCRFIDQFLTEAVEHLRKEPRIAPEVIRSVIDDAMLTQRRCQTLTDEHRALEPDLAWMALQAGQAGAAARYADAVGFSLPPEREAAVMAGLRHDAAQGDRESLTWLAMHGWRWDLPLGEWKDYVTRAVAALRADGMGTVADVIEAGEGAVAPVRPASAAR